MLVAPAKILFFKVECSFQTNTTRNFFLHTFIKRLPSFPLITTPRYLLRDSINFCSFSFVVHATYLRLRLPFYHYRISPPLETLNNPDRAIFAQYLHGTLSSRLLALGARVVFVSESSCSFCNGTGYSSAYQGHIFAARWLQELPRMPLHRLLRPQSNYRYMQQTQYLFFTVWYWPRRNDIGSRIHLQAVCVVVGLGSDHASEVYGWLWGL